jgi:hypothetical protein
MERSENFLSEFCKTAVVQKARCARLPYNAKVFRKKKGFGTRPPVTGVFSAIHFF